MKFLCGKINRLCILIILAVFAATNSIVFADESRIEFILGSNDCGGKIVYATAGEAQLSASADGINSEKIRWDSDISILAPRMQGKNLASGWSKGGYWLIEFSGGKSKQYDIFRGYVFNRKSSEIFRNVLQYRRRGLYKNGQL